VQKLIELLFQQQWLRLRVRFQHLGVKLII